MASDLGCLVSLAQSLSEHGQADAVVERALEGALMALREDAGLALVRTPRGAFRITARKGLPQVDDAAARAWCDPESPVVRAIEGGQCQLLAADEVRVTARLPIADADVRFLGIVPLLTLGKSVGGMVLFLRQEPDKLLWDDGLPYLSATAGLALAQLRFKQTIITEDRLASLGRVAAGVAHELRNPLTLLGTTLELLQDDSSLGEDGRRKLGRAHEAFRRAVSLVNGLSGFSKLARTTAELIPLSDLFSTLRDFVGAEARSRQITLSIPGNSPAPAVRGEWGQLLQVLINLVENAMEAIGRDGSIALAAEQAGDRVGIVVRDSGPGIAPDLLDCIFDPFFTTKANGTGLGLAIARDIVERLGGEIRVESRPGDGTEFTVILPAG